jgi:hypothetical protein
MTARDTNTSDLSADTAEANRDLWAARVRKVALRPAPPRPATACGKQATGQIGPHDPTQASTHQANAIPGTNSVSRRRPPHPGDDARARPRAPESSVAVAQSCAGHALRVGGCRMAGASCRVPDPVAWGALTAPGEPLGSVRAL